MDSFETSSNNKKQKKQKQNNSLMPINFPIPTILPFVKLILGIYI